MKLYVCGKIDMAHLQDCLLQQRGAMMQLRAGGQECVSMADHFVNYEDRARMARARLELMLQSDGIFLLPGWQDDVLCRHELTLACSLDMFVLASNKAIVPSRITFPVQKNDPLT